MLADEIPTSPHTIELEAAADGLESAKIVIQSHAAAVA
jgi:hypothetical protein